MSRRLVVVLVLIALSAMAPLFVAQKADAAVAQEQEAQQAQEEQQEQEAASPEVAPGPLPQEGPTDLEEAALRLVEDIMQEQQKIISGANFVYRPAGRRDPFRNLLQSRQRQLEAPLRRPGGLPGLMVDEVRIIAVAQYQGRWHAMLLGLDRRTYFVEVGSQLYDGRITEINEREVVFEQEVQDMMGARSTRPVAKKISTDEPEQQP